MRRQEKRRFDHFYFVFQGQSAILGSAFLVLDGVIDDIDETRSSWLATGEEGVGGGRGCRRVLIICHLAYPHMEAMSIILVAPGRCFGDDEK